ncbi:MAG: septum site-determining protein MinC [Schwartzia sp.]|nr:septum site-determining protein MinC [Schwartzia sp. (in: firmicutes)]
MSGEIVKLKGNRGGLQLVFAPNADFESIRADIQSKLEEGSRFFRRGTEIQIAPGTLSEVNEAVLRKLFHQHGVLFRVEAPVEPPPRPARPKKVVEPSPQPQAVPVEEAPKAIPPVEEPQMLVVNRTVRSGQEIKAPGAVMICGNVNPGAQIIAGGSIDIRGACKGVVHAGAYGDTTAFVVADQLMPTQIRIADRIAQPPENMAKPTVAERASIKNGKIVIEPIERQEIKA